MGSSSDSTAVVVGHAQSLVGAAGRRAWFRGSSPILALPVLLAMLAALVLSSTTAGAIVLPEADIRISGAVEAGPDSGGIDTGSTMEYRVTIRNAGPTTVPARGLLLVLFVDRSNSSELATIEVARFNDGGDLRPAPGGACGNGRRVLVQCTNRQALEAGEEITLRVGHRHPSPEAGTLSFVAEVSLAQPTIGDPVPGNNTYRGPNYQFTNQPTTTTTSTTTTTLTTTTETTTTTDPNGSSTTMDSTSSSSSSSTTTSSTTTPTTSTTTSTTAPTTTSTTAPTTVTQTSLAALAGSATLPGGPTTLVGPSPSNDQQVLGASGTSSGDGPPYLLLAALAALVLVITGIGTALYAHLNRPPPLVDIRHFD